MRILEVRVTNSPPIANVAMENLSDVVVLAGPNGVGKTNLLNLLLGAFRNPGSDQRTNLVVESTSPYEEKVWGGKKRVNTAVQQEATLLRSLLQRSQKRGQLRSGVLNFDSARVFENIQPYNFNWNFSDPFLEDMGWEFTFSTARQRFQDVVHALYRKVRSQKEEIAAQAIALKRSGHDEMALTFGDPLIKFKNAFSTLLPGKTLVELDEQGQQLRYTTNGTTLSIDRLSSGEKEVVTVVFDFLLRAPEDSIIVFDEPELHLHPELSYRLLRTLRDSGERNQFIYCTHSPDIISASLDQSVVFISPPKLDGANQAIAVSAEDESARVLNLLGQSVGVISLGRKLVLIEGTESSLDKQVYGTILGTSINDLVLVPTGGVETIRSFLSAINTVLDKTIWGVEFFMLCDGDASANIVEHQHARLRRLKRYHLENYFLDETVLARVFQTMGEPEGSTFRDSAQIRENLRKLATERVSQAVALRVSNAMRIRAGKLDLMPESIHGLDKNGLAEAFETHSRKEQERWKRVLNLDELTALVNAEYDYVTKSLADDSDAWKAIIPAKPILRQLASQARVDIARLKNVYIKEASAGPHDPFNEIRTIFSYFSAYPVSV